MRAKLRSEELGSVGQVKKGGVRTGKENEREKKGHERVKQHGAGRGGQGSEWCAVTRSREGWGCVEGRRGKVSGCTNGGFGVWE